VDKLEQNKTEANHKIKMLRQQLRRLELNKGELEVVIDLSEVPCEDDGTTENDVRVQLALALEEKRVKTERLSRRLRGSGKGKGKSLELEFAARTILLVRLKTICWWQQTYFLRVRITLNLNKRYQLTVGFVPNARASAAKRGSTVYYE
jgi:hypothetical protein